MTECTDLKKHLVGMIQDINKLVRGLEDEDYEEFGINIVEEDILFVLFWIEEQDDNKLMSHFVKRLLPFSKKIEQTKKYIGEDVSFIGIEDSWGHMTMVAKEIFGTIETEEITNLIDFLESELIEEADMQTYFDYFNTMLECVKKYKKQK